MTADSGLGDLVASAQGGRIDPPPTFVLDECANICKIKRLPELASHLGSKSICVCAIFQSEAQMNSVWGSDKAAALWARPLCASSAPVSRTSRS
ncbi:TraM recognition domain-containing protein [Nocardia sp. NPDC058379]|uniref:TraM recognition domain-containing protein n=1 Tax=unclassified Nocardia TaxID=2637762 RepID=UPI0036525ABF